jgi:hypothetical protein
MDDLRVFELSRLYVNERLAAAEKERLLLAYGRRPAYLSGFAARAGSILVRAGRRLEKIGGAAHTVPSFEMRQRAV